MAFTTLLMTVSLVVIASAGYPGWPDEQSAFPGFPPMMTMRFAGPPVPKFPNLPSPPPLPFFQFPSFVSMPPLHFPTLPSVQDIANGVPSPNGGTYNGVVFSSQSEAKTDENGNLVKKGGSTVIINQDGKVTIHKSGDAPPEIVTSSLSERNSTTQPHDFDSEKINSFKQPHKFKTHKPFKNFKSFDGFGGFDDFHTFPTFPTFPTFKPIKPISPETIKNTKPGKGEEYHGHLISSSSYSSNINGVVEEGGSIRKLDNDNGKVKDEKIIFHN